MEMDVEYSTSVKETIKVRGYVFGFHTGSTSKGVRFVLTDTEDHDFTEIAIRPYDSLTTNCPWMEFSLIVQKSDSGSLFNVIRILDCKKRESILTGDMLSNFLKRGDKYKNRTYDFPKKIIDLVHLKKISKSEKFTKYLVSISHEFFKGDVYHELLKYFSSVFLDKFDYEELCTIKSALSYKPFIFCFEDLIKGILFDLKTSDGDDDGDDGRVLFKKNDMITKFNIPKKNYGIYLKYLTTTNRFQIDSRCILLSAHILEFVYQDYDLIMDFDKQTLIDAMKIQMSCKYNTHSYGQTIFNNTTLLRMKSLEGINEEHIFNAKKFLIDNDLIMPAINQIGVDKFSFPSIEYSEIRLAKFLNTIVEELEIYNSIGSITGNYFLELKSINLIEKSLDSNARATQRTGLLLLSSTKDSSRSARKETGFEFFYIGDIIKAISNKTFSKTQYLNDEFVTVVLERFHKMEIGSLNELLEFFSSIKKRINLILIGDTSEYAIHPNIGGGCIMRDFCTAFPLKVKDWISTSYNERMSNIQESIMNKSMQHIIIRPITPPTTSNVKIKAIEKEAKDENIANEAQGGKNERSKATSSKHGKVNGTTTYSEEWQIFCSTEHEKDSLTELIFGSRASNGNAFHPQSFALKDRVHVTEMGLTGYIKNAEELGDDGRWRNVHAKSSMKVNQRPYRICIISGSEEITINTSSYTIIHTEVEVVNRYAGAIVERGILCVGESTKIEDLSTAAKYCSECLTIITPPSFNFMAIYGKRAIQTMTGLVNKLRLVTRFII